MAVATLLGWHRPGPTSRPGCRGCPPGSATSDPRHHLLVPAAAPELLALAARGSRPSGRATVTALAPTLQAFFTDQLARQRQGQPAHRRRLPRHPGCCWPSPPASTGKQPSRLDITDLDAPLVGAFLDHLENERGNSVRTRNARLAAVHSLFSFAALRHPEHARRHPGVAGDPAPSASTASSSPTSPSRSPSATRRPGQLHPRRPPRPRAAVARGPTGLRVSELTGLTQADVFLGTGAHVTCTGKGRKQRITPLTPATAKILAAWLGEHPGNPGGSLFPSRAGTPMSRDAVERRLAKHAAAAATAQPSLKGKKISPHVMRHTAAMRLLAAGVDTTVIALWLGHESVATTQIYIHADLAIKEKALARTAPLERPARTLPAPGPSPGIPRVTVIMPPPPGPPPLPARHRTAASA